MLDLIFQASAPTGAAAARPFMPVEAILPIETGHPYKAVRVRGGNQRRHAEDPPGLRRRPPAPKEDCAKCIGKIFVAKGANPPAGCAADDIVREADLPCRCASSSRPTAFRATLRSEPADARAVRGRPIVDAAWD